jgi:glutamate-1-semialdehyde 2,1-aminomutase
MHPTRPDGAAPRFAKKPRSLRERDLLAQSARILPSAVRSASFDPELAMVVDGARGSRIRDCSGNEYIDYLLGSGPMFLGHAHPALLEAARAQLEKGTAYLMVNEPAIRLAEEIVTAVPCAEQVSFHNSGSEATFFAMRLARAHRRRDKVLKFEGAYHGMGDAALMSTQWSRHPAAFPAAAPDSAGIPVRARDDTLVAPFNDIETTAAIIEAHADELACVIVEPLHRTIPPRDGFLDALRRVTSDHAIPLIFDEVVTGFRLSFGGAQAFYGVTPDLCALGKTISGGHPLGVVCGRKEIMSHASPERMVSGGYVRLTGTFSSNPVSCAVALAVIEELKRPGFYAAVEGRGRRLREGLEGLLQAAEIPARVVGEATVFQPWFTEEPVTDHRSALRADARRNLRFVDLLLRRGVVKAHEKFFVSAAHSDEDIAITLDALEGAISALRGEGSVGRLRG